MNSRQVNAKQISDSYKSNYLAGHGNAVNAIDSLLTKTKLTAGDYHIIRTIIFFELQVHNSECLSLIKKIETIYHPSHDAATEATMDFYLNDIKVFALICANQVAEAKSCLFEKLKAIKTGQIRKDKQGNWKKEPEFTVKLNIKSFNYYLKYANSQNEVEKVTTCNEIEKVLSTWYSEISKLPDYSDLKPFSTIKPNGSHPKTNSTAANDNSFFQKVNQLTSKLLTTDYHYESIKTSFGSKLLTDRHCHIRK